ncbi:GDSL-type esterase/lipase family protein [Adlercreutzia sp. ZJ473]|uniref:SGNH/GDSL hydrolase family protein n=1 Tax=Adlercreutzia sp. ZJ473 TaxID=2722822 RepID=UPI0015547D27|nr:GDSL-type esterase/lipase family protein [Adlercreutzia sp. ZJ473]
MTRLFSVYGDSISSFEGALPEGWRVFYEGEQRAATGVDSVADTWWGQVIGHFEGELLANAAWSGCVVEGTEFPVGASAERIAALARDGRAPDDIIVHIGINDYGWGSGDAQIAAATPSAPPKLAAACPYHGREAGMAPEGAVANFAASYGRMVDQMRERWPEARIWVSTLLPGRVAGARRPTSPRYFRGVCVDEYNDAIRAVAAAREGCYLVDMAAFGFDYDAIDGTHPTAKGMRQMAALFIRGMEQACAELPRTPYAGADLLTEDMRSAEFCTRPCVGCEHARGTGNSWWHVCERQLADA